MRYRRKYQIRLWVAVLILLAGLTGCPEKDRPVYDSAAEEITTEAAETETTGEEKAASIWVYVCGEVRDPGVYELPEGSRITDAVEAAGGMTGDAAETYLNLAETLSDGQKIEVPSVEMAEALEELPRRTRRG